MTAEQAANLLEKVSEISDLLQIISIAEIVMIGVAIGIAIAIIFTIIFGKV